MSGQTVRLVGPKQIQLAHRLIDKAPEGAVFNIRESTRTDDQNALMWVLLSDIARAKPQGRKMTTDAWKCMFLAAVGHKMVFEPSLDGEGVVPLGYKSSRLTKAQMSDLIESILAYGSEHGVAWSEPARP